MRWPADWRTAPMRRPWHRHGIALAIGAGLLGIGWFTLEIVTDRVPGWEEDLFVWVNGLSDVLWPVVWPFMQLGNFWAIFGVAVLLLAVFRRWQPPVAALAAGIGAWAVAKVVKDTVERDRPGALIAEADVREGGIEGLGFVSGHAAVAFALATVVVPWLPGRWKVLPWVLAAVVGFARVYSGAHLPLDVVGGAGVGIMCGTVVNAVVCVPEPAEAPVAPGAAPTAA